MRRALRDRVELRRTATEIRRDRQWLAFLRQAPEESTHA
jgi:hypothetical protein